MNVLGLISQLIGIETLRLTNARVILLVKDVKTMYMMVTRVSTKR